MGKAKFQMEKEFELFPNDTIKNKQNLKIIFKCKGIRLSALPRNYFKYFVLINLTHSNLSQESKTMESGITLLIFYFFLALYIEFSQNLLNTSRVL